MRDGRILLRHFEDFKTGEVISLGNYTVTEAEILAYARKYDPQPFHIDPEAARRSIYRGLIASGWHTCAIVMRLSVEMHERLGALSAGSPGVETCRWLKPVRPGDTLSVTTEALEAWPSRSRPFGFVRRRVDVSNQRGEMVMTLTGLSMYLRREETGPGAGPVSREARGAIAAPAAGRPPQGPAAPGGRLYFEDLEVGETWRFGAYPVTREEIVEFAHQFDPQPFHLDEAAARESLFGGLVASGWHTAAMFIHMVAEYMAPRIATQGAMGFDDLKWLKPVRPGDVLSVESVLREKIESRRRADRGIVKIASRVLNQHGEPVMSLVSLVIFLRRPTVS